MLIRNLLYICVLAGALSGLQVKAAVKLSCDFTNAENRRSPMLYHWDVSNRISPMERFNMPVGDDPFINIVRPLGGKSRNDEKLIEEDTYKWDGSTYIYDWAPLKKQIDTVQAKARIFQLMIDNVPWAFQRGIDFKGENEVETYGNAWPPNDPEAWARYIQAMLKELVNTYGREQVGQWRYCIGREIGTEGHWRGSMEEFFEHYRSTVNAIHSVLPEAKVGAHFLWASSKNSFGPDFVKWCRQNEVHYDFVGISFYPFYDRANRVDLERVYEADFAPIKDIPEWTPDATLEIHEFALITSMSKKGNSFDKAPKAHQESFTAMLAKMMYEHDMLHVFRWGTGEGMAAEQALLSMEGNTYYTSSKEGEPKAENMIDAVFARDETSSQYNILVYNYNANPDAKKTEAVEIVATIPSPPDTVIEYRAAVYEKDGLDWSKWKTHSTKPVAGSDNSMLELEIELPTFSFAKIEIRAPKATDVKRVLTDRETGRQIEVELVEVKGDNVSCIARGRRFDIPVSALSDEDQAFLKQWMLEN